jgi:hypothetical protein
MTARPPYSSASTSQPTSNPPPSRQPLTDTPKPSIHSQRGRQPRQYQPVDLSTIEVVDLTDPTPSGSSRRRLNSPTSDRPSKRSKGKDPEIISLDDDGFTPPAKSQDRNKSPQSGSLNMAKCVICLDAPTDLTATPCGTFIFNINSGHLFCDFCIRSALKTGQGGGRGRGAAAVYSGACPICRRRITTKSLIPLEIKVRTLG